MTARVTLLIETLLLFFLPLTLLQLYPPLFQLRIPFLAIGLIYVFFFSYKAKFTPKQLGLTWPKLQDLMSLIPLLLLILILPHFFSFQETGSIVLHAQNLPINIYIPVYIFLSVPIQEIIFRGFYITRLELISKNHLFLMLFSSLIFALLHLPFHSISIIIGTFILGLYTAYCFIHQRNIWVPCIIHASMIYFVLLSK